MYVSGITITDHHEDQQFENNHGGVANAFEISGKSSGLIRSFSADKPLRRNTNPWFLVNLGPTLHPILVQCQSATDKSTWLGHLNELLRATRCFSAGHVSAVLSPSLLPSSSLGAAGSQVRMSKTDYYHHTTSATPPVAFPFVRLVAHFRELYELGVLVTLSNQFLNERGWRSDDHDDVGDHEDFDFREGSCWSVNRRRCLVDNFYNQNRDGWYWRGGGEHDDGDEGGHQNASSGAPPFPSLVFRKFRCLSNIHDGSGIPPSGQSGSHRRVHPGHRNRGLTTNSVDGLVPLDSGRNDEQVVISSRDCSSLPSNFTISSLGSFRNRSSTSSSNKRVLVRQDAFDYGSDSDSVDSGLGDNNFGGGAGGGPGGDDRNIGEGDGEPDHQVTGNHEEGTPGGDPTAGRRGMIGSSEEEEEEECYYYEESAFPNLTTTAPDGLVYYNEVFVNVSDRAVGGGHERAVATYTNRLYAHWCLKIESDAWSGS